MQQGLLGKAQERVWPECKIRNSVCEFSGQSPSSSPGVSVAVGRLLIRRSCKYFHYFMVLLEGGKMSTHCRRCTNGCVSLVTPSSPSNTQQVHPSPIQTWRQKYSPEGITSLACKEHDLASLKLSPTQCCLWAFTAARPPGSWKSSTMLIRQFMWPW